MYVLKDYRTYKRDDEGELILLANFVAVITHEVRLVDDEATEISVTLTGEMPNDDPDIKEPVRLPPITMSAEAFTSMGWVISHWGVRCVMRNGTGVKEDMRVCIQMNSRPVVKIVYKHIGWTKINGKPAYVHAGGAISAKGNDPSVQTKLPPEIARYRFSAPQEADTIVAAQASLDLLGLGKPEIMWPMLAATYAPVLQSCDFALHTAGRTGTFKSEVASLLQSHYGSAMDARHLPGSWGSTSNALEALAHYAKNAVIVIDDFVPSGSPFQQKSYHQTAEKLIRAAGNQQGRQRLTDMSKMQSTMYPRGLIFSTGEEIYEGHSIRGRSLILELSPGDISRDVLTRCQAKREVLPLAMGKFIQHIAGTQTSLGNRVVELRTELQSIGHTRTPSMLGKLIASAEVWLSWCLEIGAIQQHQYTRLVNEARVAIIAAGEKQKQYLESADPCEVFLNTVRQMLEGKTAHIKTLGEGEPHNAEALGWVKIDGGFDEVERFKASGTQIGWVSYKQQEVYLNDTVAFQLVKKVAGTEMPLSKQTMIKRLVESGDIVRTDDTRQRNTVRVKAGGSVRQVLCFALETFIDDSTEVTASE